jgi:GntR family transcriptional regulator
MTDATTSPGVPQAAPLYRELERAMRDALASGEWKPGEAIPAERRLAERHGVSIGTVRKAIDALVDANLLIRQQGRGTFVATHTRDRLLYYFFHVVPEHGPKEYPDVRMVSFARGKADRAEAERLGLAPGDPVFRICNVLHLGGAPVIVDDIAIAAARFPGLTDKQFRERPSTIYHLYQDAFGVTVARSSERLRTGVADANVAAHLGMARGAPVLEIRRVAHDVGGEPVEWRVSRVNTARHEYSAELG